MGFQLQLAGPSKGQGETWLHRSKELFIFGTIGNRKYFKRVFWSCQTWACFCGWHGRWVFLFPTGKHGSLTGPTAGHCTRISTKPKEDGKGGILIPFHARIFDKSNLQVYKRKILNPSSRRFRGNLEVFTKKRQKNQKANHVWNCFINLPIPLTFP